MLRMMTAGGRSSFCDSRRDFDPVHLGHPDVDDERLGLMLLAEPQRLEAIRRLGDDGQARVALEQAPQAAPDDAVVVSQQHAHA